MSHRPSVSVPQPCAQSWDAMLPTAAGRHCAACATTVTDFTRHTDDELLAYFRRAGAGRTCGRFRVEQLNRPSRLGTASASRWRAGLAAVVALWGLREAAAPAVRAQAPTEQRQPISGTIATSKLDTVDSTAIEAANAPWMIRGQVLDKSDRQGLPGATVLLAGTPYGCSTDAMGNFALTVPAELAPYADPITLRFNSIGYISQEMTVSTLRTLSPIVQLEVEVKGLMGEICVNYRQPWPWHPRRFWFWLTRPLRGY